MNRLQKVTYGRDFYLESAQQPTTPTTPAQVARLFKCQCLALVSQKETFLSGCRCIHVHIIRTLSIYVKMLTARLDRYPQRRIQMWVWGRGNWVAVSLSRSAVAVNSYPHEQNGHHFSKWHFKYIFLNENDRIPIPISLKFGQLRIRQHWFR